MAVLERSPLMTSGQGEKDGSSWLGSLLSSLGWSYAALWTLNLERTKLVWKDGWYNLDNVGTIKEVYNAKLLYSTYKSCSFTPGFGLVGSAYSKNRPDVWRKTQAQPCMGMEQEQLQFLMSADIQTMLFIPMVGHGVLELGTVNLVVEGDSILEQILTFLCHELAHTAVDSFDTATTRSPESVSRQGLMSPRTFFSVPKLSLNPPTFRNSATAVSSLLPQDQNQRPINMWETDWRAPQSDVQSSSMMSPCQHRSHSDTPSSSRSCQDQDDAFQTSRRHHSCSPEHHMSLMKETRPHHDSPDFSLLARRFYVLRSMTGLEVLTDSNRGTSLHHLRTASPNCDSTGCGIHNLMLSGGGECPQEDCDPYTTIPTIHIVTDAQRGTHPPGSVGQSTLAQALGSTRPYTSASAPGGSLLGQDEDAKAKRRHTMAERTRRETQNKLFVALRQLVPLSSKRDKASTLRDTIEYVRQQHEYIEELEAKVAAFSQPHFQRL